MGKLSETTAAAAGISQNTNTTKTPTSEQLRIAQLLVDPKSDDHSIKDKVGKVMELTRCNESTALVALHDCDNDVEQAVDKLLEGDHQGEWIVQEGKKSKKVNQHQQQSNYHQSSYEQHQYRSSKDNNYHHHQYSAEDGGGNHFDDENSTSAPYQSRGGGAGRGGGGGDFPPRFRGRGGASGGVRPPRRFDKENEPFESFGGSERGRGRGRGGFTGMGRGGGRDFGGERGRGRGGFAGRGGRRGGGFGGREDGAGFDQQMGSWDSNEAAGAESNTWDNSMANSQQPGSRRQPEEWKGAEESNTWDNSMAQSAAAPVANKKPQRSNEWNNNNNTNSTDDWEGETDWSKGLVIESSGVQKKPSQHPQQQQQAQAPVSSSQAGPPSYASAANAANHARGESIDVNTLFSNQMPDGQSTNSWASKQATADLKNELGIGKSPSSQLQSSAPPMRLQQQPQPQQQREPLAPPQAAPTQKLIGAKVELPSMGNRSGAIGPIDVQFGDMTLLSDSQPLFAFDAPSATVFKSTSSAQSQSQDPMGMRQGQIDSTNSSAFQRASQQKAVAHSSNGPTDLLLGSNESGAKSNNIMSDVTSSGYPIGHQAGSFATNAQSHQDQQFGSTNAAANSMRQMGGQTSSVKNANSGVSSLTSDHQRALMSGGITGGARGSTVPGGQTTAINDSAVHNPSAILNSTGHLAHGGSTAASNYGLSQASAISRSPAGIPTSKPQVSSALNVNAQMPTQYQQAMAAAGLSPAFMNLYDQMSLNSVGFLPQQNLFMNAANAGFDLRTLTQMPPLAGNNMQQQQARDSSDMKAYMRQDTGSNMGPSGAGAGMTTNLSVPPPGLPAPTASNAEQAAQILSMAGMYPTFPLINTAPPFLAPQFLVPNVSAAPTVTTGSQYQRASGYPQGHMFNTTGYEDLQLASQDFGKNNYGALPNTNQTKSVSSGSGGGMPIGMNDNKGYGGLKGYDSKSFVAATGTPPSLGGNMNFAGPFQSTAGTGAAAYGYPSYMPPMNLMASPMAALASNVPLSSDLLGTGAMNQRGIGGGGVQNSKNTSSNMGKPPQGQYQYGWGN